MFEIAPQIGLDMREMSQIIGLLIAFVEPDKNTENFGCTLRAQNGVALHKIFEIEAHLLRAAAIRLSISTDSVPVR